MATGGSHSKGIRIVLLGWRGCGKSLAANTILSCEDFQAGTTTANCVKSEREVAGREITVLDTPGWWTYSFNFKKSVEQVTDHLVNAVSLCAPGPHAFLLVIPVNVTFTEEQKNAIEKHQLLLGEHAWNFTFVLFFLGYWLGGKSIEEHIESQGSALKWLVEKCGNRYHVLNNKDSLTRVTALLEKIEKMVTDNGDCHFVIDRKVQEQVEKRQNEVKYRAFKRKTNMERKRESLRREHTEESRHLSEVRIVLLGPRRSRKSSAGNTILGNEGFETDKRTAQCVVRQGRVFGRQVTIVDTPGWWRDHEIRNTPELDKQELRYSSCLCPPGPHVLLLVVPISSSFTGSHAKIMKQHLRLLGDGLWNHTMILFTMGDFLGGKSIEQHIESDDIGLQRLVDESGNRYHVLNNMDKGDITQVKELLEKIEEMVALNGGRCLGMDESALHDKNIKCKEMEGRATERRMKAEIKRKILTSFLHANGHHLSDIKVILLGTSSSARSLASNNILGRRVFLSEGGQKCLTGESKVDDRLVKVVNAPSWAGITQNPIPDLLRQELEGSVSHCPSGPHAFLIVIRTDLSFTPKHKTSVEEHMKVFGEGVWKYAMVLFTHGHWLGDRSIEEHIESEGVGLRWLVEKCGSRYHVFDNEGDVDTSQVPQLLTKIEEMVTGYDNGQFSFNKHKGNEEYRDRELAIQLMAEEEWKRINRSIENEYAPGIMASASFAEEKDLKNTRVHTAAKPPSELRLVLLGGRASGKSSAGNTLLGQELFDTHGVVKESVKKQREVAGRQITVVDTPGWGRHTAQNTPKAVKQEMKRSVSLCHPGPHAVLLTFDLNASFTEKHKTEVEEHLQLLGGTIWKHVIVLFTRGDLLEHTSIEQHIESEGKDLKWLIEKCGRRYHVFDNKHRENDTQVTLLLKKIVEMISENGDQSFFKEVAPVTVLGDVTKEDGREEELLLKEEIKAMLDEELRKREEGLVQTLRSMMPPLRPRGARSIDIIPPTLSGAGSDSAYESAASSEYSEASSREKLPMKSSTSLKMKKNASSSASGHKPRTSSDNTGSLKKTSSQTPGINMKPGGKNECRLS